LFEYVGNTWPGIQETKNGVCLFTQPSTPIKCGGAPQKIMYVADDVWKKSNAGNTVKFLTGTGGIFGSPAYAKALNEICKEKKISTSFNSNLVEITENKEAIFEVKNGESVTRVTEKFDFIHVTPPMVPPEFISKSSIGNAGGFVDVDKSTMQHVKYPNIFSLGDSSSLPTSKTAAAISAQTPILVDNIIAVMDGKKPTREYDGYSGCPILVGDNKLMLAEFDYTLNPTPSFISDQTKPTVPFYYLKTKIFPWVYWNKLIKGTWRNK
jgi:sulfide:quinone oxidoreductase